MKFLQFISMYMHIKELPFYCYCYYYSVSLLLYIKLYKTAVLNVSDLLSGFLK